MIILNHNLISKLNIVNVNSVYDINNTIPSDFLILSDLTIAKFCHENNIDYAANVGSILDSLLFVNLGVKFLLCDSLSFAKELQKLAEEYLFDCKVLVKIKTDGEIEYIARSGIDGVIFTEEA